MSKNIKYKVIDNFLEREEFARLQTFLMSWDFPWYYQAIINGDHDMEDLDCYFTHGLYDVELGVGYSNFFNIVKPLLNIIKPKALIRIKCNNYPRTEKVRVHKPHCDYPYTHKGALFYINTCDGGTILENGKKIDSVENRILFFEADKPHSSTSTSNAKSRININFNYF